MDKQRVNIGLTSEGKVRFKNGREEQPKNAVLKIENGIVYFTMNYNMYIGKVDIADYFRLSLWAHTLTFDHANTRAGVIAYDNGYEHKSLAAAIMQTDRKHKVYYGNFNRFDCSRNNLIVAENNHRKNKR